MDFSKYGFAEMQKWVCGRNESQPIQWHFALYRCGEIAACLSFACFDRSRSPFMQMPFYNILFMPIARKLDVAPVLVEFAIFAGWFLLAWAMEPSNVKEWSFWLSALGFTVGVPIVQILLDKKSLMRPSDSGQ